MKKYLKVNLIKIIVSLAFLIMSFSSMMVQATGTTYYIDPSASTNGNGTQLSPFKYWSSVTWTAGNTYLQKCGTTANEQVNIGVSGTSGSLITLGSYGTGSLPVISGFTSVQNLWSVAQGYIYKRTLTWANGIVMQDGSPLKWIQWNTNVATTFSGASAGTFSFNPSTKIVYVWCTNNASPSTHTMQISKNSLCINAVGKSYIAVQNLSLTGATTHALQFKNSIGCSVSGVTIQNCGGAYSGSWYYGNGIEFGDNSSYCSVTGCTIDNIFDSGITPQVYTSSCNCSSIWISSNSISNCGMAGIELSVLVSDGTLSSVTVQSNIIDSCGSGWSGTRGNTEGYGIIVQSPSSVSDRMASILVDSNTVSNSSINGIMVSNNVGYIQITNNEVYGSLQNGIQCTTLSNPNTTSYYLYNNYVYNNSGHGLFYYNTSGSGFNIDSNRFYNNGTGGYLNFYILGFNAGAAKYITNNSFYDTDGPEREISGALNAGSSVDYNTYYRNGSTIVNENSTNYTEANFSSYQSATGQDVHSSFADWS